MIKRPHTQGNTLVKRREENIFFSCNPPAEGLKDLLKYDKKENNSIAHIFVHLLPEKWHLS